jgi:hypothetical protein
MYKYLFLTLLFSGQFSYANWVTDLPSEQFRYYQMFDFEVTYGENSNGYSKEGISQSSVVVTLERDISGKLIIGAQNSKVLVDLNGDGCTQIPYYNSFSGDGGNVSSVAEAQTLICLSENKNVIFGNYWYRTSTTNSKTGHYSNRDERFKSIIGDAKKEWLK